ncbi:MAG: radical SAM protein [Heliobacteriaceae bacterium]|jgi:anaerobic ribonucleoside-triphosphate reductase activating protein|nr:radical SAM protein [Heliobacteriaceae bacterium]
MKLRIFKTLSRTRAEGPGERFCIWVQGCSRHCPGCRAQETWTHNSGEIISVSELFEKIKYQKTIEGVTFLGGEPFEQAKALALLAKKVKNTGLSVLTFTGNTLEELKAKNDNDINSLLKYTDLLIDGAFEEDKFDLSRPWTGSSNQRYIFLSSRYSLKDIKNTKNKIEIRISPDGSAFINGMGNFDKITSMLTGARE